jgi:hypothetical protein
MSNAIGLDQGGAVSRILVQDGTQRPLRFAAAELARYLALLGGPALPVAAGRQATPGTFFLTVDPALAHDGFAIAGEDGALVIRGGQSRGVLYGVYALLERLGCRFLAPGRELVPRLAELRLPTARHAETPAFPVRNVFRNAVAPSHTEPFAFLDPAVTIPELDWLAKRRYNHFAFYVDYYRLDLWEKHKGPILDALLDRGFTIEQSYHSLHYFCPPDENHDFGQYGPSTYLRHHPDWYLPAMERGPRGLWQTRIELPAVRDVIRERFLAYFRRNPELDILGLWPDDVPMNNPDPQFTPADGYLDFWNDLAATLAAELPAKRLGIIAYFELIRPPRRQRPRPNQQCWFCPLERNYQYPLDHALNRHWREPLQRWTELMGPGRLAIFEYYGWAVPFIPFREFAAQDLASYRELGAGGLYTWAGFTDNILGKDRRLALDLYVLAHQLWDPATPLRPLEEEWTAGLFGPAAAPVLELFDRLKAEHRRQAALGLGGYFDWKNDYSHLTLEFTRALLPLFDAALARAEGPAIEWLRRYERQLLRATTHEVTRADTEPPPMYWAVKA